MAVDYHGPKPVTKSDVKMAKKHLKDTQKLLKKKIADHQDARQMARSMGNQQSMSYNAAHMKSHMQDMRQVNQSLNTLMKGRGMANFNTKKTGTYKGQSNAPGGGGRFKQMTDQGMSKGLAAYIGRKKFGAKRMAKMAAAGRKSS